MKDKLKQIIGKILTTTKILPLVLLYLKTSYLKEEGWQKSALEKLPIDKNGLPIPWYTYPCIDFIKSHLKKKVNVFEYGVGNSTIWWSKFAKDVISCEHNKSWIENINPHPKNIKINYKNLDEGYVDFIKNFENYFDIIIIDGRKRNECMKNCLIGLKKDGIIILDDSEREKYEEGCKYLSSNGYKRIDFWGMRPIFQEKSSTTIFYKENNIFEI